MSATSSIRYGFEPLGDHDHASFSCGVPELDDYLRRQARQDAKRNVAASFVMVDRGRAVIGYYTLSAYGLRAAELPHEVARKLPRYPLIPATLLGRLAIGQAYQGQKLGRLLLMDALHRSWKNASEVASAGVVTKAYDEPAREFYLHHEFISLPDHPRKLFIAMGTIQKTFAQR